MASASAKKIRARLEQIKDRAAEENARAKTKSSGVTGWDLAEEAAGLGIEALDLKEKK